MRIAVRFLGLDLFELSVDTDGPADDYGDPGDCTTYPVGFSVADKPAEFDMPDRE